MQLETKQTRQTKDSIKLFAGKLKEWSEGDTEYKMNEESMKVRH